MYRIAKILVDYGLNEEELRRSLFLRVDHLPRRANCRGHEARQPLTVFGRKT